MRWVRYGMVDFSKRAVRVWVGFSVFDLLLVLQVFSSGTNQDEYFSDLSAFLANIEQRASLQIDNFSRFRDKRALS